MQIEEVYQKMYDGDVLQMPQGVWLDLDNARRVLRYAVENLMNIPIEQLPSKMTISMLNQYRLRGMYTVVRKKTTLAQLIQDTFPEQDWKPWQFFGYPTSNWEDPVKREEAVVWLISKCGNQGLTRKIVAEHGLATLLYKYYENSVAVCLRNHRV